MTRAKSLVPGLVRVGHSRFPGIKSAQLNHM
jgi:hypothetical protein